MISIIARSFASWFVRDPENPYMIFLINITEPILSPVRRILPTFGAFDASPVVVIVILVLLQRFLVDALLG